MGLSTGSLSTEQIYLSSKHHSLTTSGAGGVFLNSESGWRPSSDSPHENVIVSCLVKVLFPYFASGRL